MQPVQAAGDARLGLSFGALIVYWQLLMVTEASYTTIGQNSLDQEMTIVH